MLTLISCSFPARPVFVRSYSRDKLDTLVDFPLTGLDMGPYLLPQVCPLCAWYDV